MWYMSVSYHIKAHDEGCGTSTSRVMYKLYEKRKKKTPPSESISLSRNTGGDSGEKSFFEKRNRSCEWRAGAGARLRSRHLRTSVVCKTHSTHPSFDIFQLPITF